MEQHIPTPEEVQAWPVTVKNQEREQERTKAIDRLAKLEAQAADLRERIASGQFIQPPGWQNGMDPGILEAKLAREAKEDQEAKDTIFTYLGKLALSDGETATARFVEFIDRDLAGGYDVVHTVAVSHKAGVFVAGRQYAFANNQGVERNLSPHFQQFILHAGSINPLKLEEHGTARSLLKAYIPDFIPTQWSDYAVEDNVKEITEAIRADRMVKTVQLLLPTETLQPVTYPNGETSTYQLRAERNIHIAPGIKVLLRALYIRHHEYDKQSRQNIELPPSFYAAQMELELAGKRKEKYAINVKSLEIGSGHSEPYAPYNEINLHDGAEAILQLAQAAIDKDKD